MDCFAEPVIGWRFAPTRWLVMTEQVAMTESDHVAAGFFFAFGFATFGAGASASGLRSIEVSLPAVKV